MKIKNVLLLSGVGAAVAAVLRFINFYLFFDRTSEFLTDNGLLSFIGAGCIGIIFIYILSMAFSKKDKPCVAVPKKGYVRGLVSVVCAMLAFYTSWTMWKSYLYQSGMGITEVSVTGLSFRLPFIVATFVLSAYLLFYGIVSVLNKESILIKAKIVEIIPVLWGLILIVYVFIHYSVSYLPSENIFVIISTCALTVGLMSKAKISADLDDKGRGMLKLSCAGALGAMLCLSYAVSNIALFVMGFSYKADLPIGVQLVMAAVSVNLLIFTETVEISEKIIIKEPERKGTRFKSFK